MRAAGRPHGIPKRRWMCGWICDPNPTTARPPLASWSDHAAYAKVMGVRAKAMATPVANSIRGAVAAAWASCTSDDALGWANPKSASSTLRSPSNTSW